MLHGHEDRYHTELIQGVHENILTFAPGYGIELFLQFLTWLSGRRHNPTKWFQPSKSLGGPSLWIHNGGTSEKGGNSRLSFRNRPGLSWGSSMRSVLYECLENEVVIRNVLLECENCCNSLSASWWYRCCNIIRFIIRWKESWSGCSNMSTVLQKKKGKGQDILSSYLISNLYHNFVYIGLC